MTYGTFYCGTSGLVLPVPNKQHFPAAYRDKPRLSYYASLFNSIEINSSFYKIPRETTFSRWAAETPPAFRFTVKLWQGITHAGGLPLDGKSIGRFLQAAKALGEKKGCLLVQLPPSFRSEKAPGLERLLAYIVESDPNREWKLAVEFRHPGWYTPTTDKLLERFSAARVLQDMPASLSWEHNEPVPFVYLRYHGPTGDYKGNYSGDRLRTDAATINRWLAAGKDVYVYFNNTIGNALPNVQELRTMVIDRPLPQPQ